MPSAVMVVVAAVMAIIVFHPRISKTRHWRATVTPLASIIGSGFLVAGPILAHIAGNWAWLAMAALCTISFLFGSAIRQNVAVVEPMMEKDPPRYIVALERTCEFALALAYFVSVAYYISLFASFALKAFDIVDPLKTRYIATGVIALIGVIGTLRGLRALERVELIAVGLKLALICGLLAALTYLIALSFGQGTFALPSIASESGLEEVRVLLGLVVLVQGFETSRFLGEAYGAKMRIATMRNAQLLSSVIYVVFILLITPYFPAHLPKVGGETQIIDILRPLGTLIAPLLIVAALCSQLSAAVADMNGAGGLLNGATGSRVPVKVGYFATACVAILIIWSADIFQIIVYASKAFVIYYGLQCVTAALLAKRENIPGKHWRMGLFWSGAALALVILVFGTSIEGTG